MIAQHAVVLARRRLNCGLVNRRQSRALRSKDRRLLQRGADAGGSADAALARHVATAARTGIACSSQPGPVPGRLAARAAIAIAVNVGFFSGPVVKQLASHTTTLGTPWTRLNASTTPNSGRRCIRADAAVVHRRSRDEVVERADLHGLPASANSSPEPRPGAVEGARRHASSKAWSRCSWLAGSSACHPAVSETRHLRPSGSSCRAPARRSRRIRRLTNVASRAWWRADAHRHRRRQQRTRSRRTALGRCTSGGRSPSADGCGRAGHHSRGWS